MHTGRMKQRVTIRANTPSVDAYGEATAGWADVEEVYADLRKLSYDERLMAERRGSTVTHKVSMRYRNDLGAGDVEMQPAYRVQYEGREFEVERVIDVGERHKWLELFAREVG